MIWRNDDNDRPPIPPRAALLLLIWLAGLLWLLVACSPHMAAGAPQLSNVQPGQIPDLVVYTVEDRGWYYVTACETGYTHSCRTVVATSEDTVMQWVLKLQEDNVVEYIS
jgi:hypothetical protein